MDLAQVTGSSYLTGKPFNVSIVVERRSLVNLYRIIMQEGIFT